MLRFSKLYHRIFCEMFRYLSVFIFIQFTFLTVLNFVSCDFDGLSEEWPNCDKKFLNGTYTVMHKLYCDRYFACNNGEPHLMKCEPGYAYSPYLGCKLTHKVNCGNRTIIRETNVSESGGGECPTLFGLFEDKHGCGKYTICYNGTAYSGQCPNSLVYDDKGKYCRTPTPEEKQKCLPPPALLGCTLGPDGVNQGSCIWFQCPALNILPFGDHSKHAYPGHCHYYIKCYNDGSIRIEMCPQGSGFNEEINRCDSESKVPSCISQQPTSSYLSPQQQSTPTAVPTPPPPTQTPSFLTPQQQTPPSALTYPSPQQQSTRPPPYSYVSTQQQTSPPAFSPPLQHTTPPSLPITSLLQQSTRPSIPFISFSTPLSQIFTARPI